MRYWLMKTEPNTFSIQDLKKRPGRTEPWDGVRNYRARNIMRDEMRAGDRVLFYHSGKNPGVVGTAHVVREGYPDHTAQDPDSDHFDPKSSPEKPIWYMVDIQFDSEFETPLYLKDLRGVPELKNMMLLKKGARLSVQPVSPSQFETILEIAGLKSRT